MVVMVKIKVVVMICFFLLDRCQHVELNIECESLSLQLS